MMKTLLLALLFFWPVAQLQVFGDDDDDKYTIVLGKRVGPIRPGMTFTDLLDIYGKNIQEGLIPGPEGSTFDGAYVFRGTDKELQIIWNQEIREKVVSNIRVIGKEWDFKNDLKLGKSIKDVEEINGGPFRVWGFDWDLGGYADFEGGRLAGLVGIRFSPKSDKVSERILGDQLIPSNAPEMRDAKPEVVEITVNFP